MDCERQSIAPGSRGTPQNQLMNFISYQFLKFKSGYDVTKHVGGYRRRPISKDKEKKILKTCLDKEHSGLTGVAHKIGVSFSTVRNVLKRNVSRTYHKYKT